MSDQLTTDQMNDLGISSIQTPSAAYFVGSTTWGTDRYVDEIVAVEVPGQSGWVPGFNLIRNGRVVKHIPYHAVQEITFREASDE